MDVKDIFFFCLAPLSFNLPFYLRGLISTLQLNLNYLNCTCKIFFPKLNKIVENFFPSFQIGTYLYACIISVVNLFIYTIHRKDLDPVLYNTDIKYH